MPTINWKLELKLRWTKHCVLSVLGIANNNDGDGNDYTIWSIIDTKLNVPVATLSAKATESDQNFLPKDLKDQCIEMNIKEKGKIKIQQIIIDIFSNRTL